MKYLLLALLLVSCSSNPEIIKVKSDKFKTPEEASEDSMTLAKIECRKLGKERVTSLRAILTTYIYANDTKKYSIERTVECSEVPFSEQVMSQFGIR